MSESERVNPNAPSQRYAELTNHMAATNPTVPQMRIAGNLSTGRCPLAFSIANVVVLASASVGM